MRQTLLYTDTQIQAQSIPTGEKRWNWDLGRHPNGERRRGRTQARGASLVQVHRVPWAARLGVSLM